MTEEVAVSRVVRQLGEEGYRLTAPRRLVLDAVLPRDAPFSAQEVVADLAPRGVGRATVFRTLDVLVKLGVLNRIHADDRIHRYTVCDDGHHHHLVCRVCGEVTDAAPVQLESAVRAAARDAGFLPLGHSLEIYGICRACQAAGHTAARQ
jgi:Fur family transcriptional regulator, ferric uptake regulator